MKLLAVVIGCIGVQTAQAELRFSPALVYEPFDRPSPERAGVIRIGGGLRMIAPTLVEPLGFEIEGQYMNETTPFASENTLKETMFRARGGLNVKFFELAPVRFNARGGFQYNFITDIYERKVLANRDTSHINHSTAYGGLEAELVPVSGFGIIAGAAISGHEPMNRWIPQYYLGIVLW